MPSLLKTAKSADSWLPSAERRKIQTLDQCFPSEKKRGIDAGISIRKDGSFSARSVLGKELQKSMADLEISLERLEDEHSSLSTMPFLRWSRAHEKYNFYSKKAAGYKWGIIGWIIVVWFYEDAGAGISAQQIIQSYWTLATYFFDNMPNQIALTYAHLEALAIATGSSLALYFIRTKISFRPYQGCPRPEFVTIENVDDL